MIKYKKLLHIGFEIGIIAKGINGVIETVAGFLLLFISNAKINETVSLLTSYSLTKQQQGFIMSYSLVHGIIKCLIVFLLWKGKKWVYGLSVVLLSLFTVYQIYQFYTTKKLFVIALIVMDIVVIILAIIEYFEKKSIIKH